MTLLEQILKTLKIRMEVPTAFGWFHIMWIAIVAAITALLVIFFRNAKDKTYRRIVFIFWLIIFLFEIYKQLDFAFDYDPLTDTSSWDFKWYIFPFQFCSSALYVFPLVAFLKDGKVRDSIIAFTGLYVLFAGLLVYCIPQTVYVSHAIINIQTMVHHGSQIIVGIYTLVYFRKKLSFSFFLKAIPTFVVFMIVAIALNEIIPLIIDLTDTTFDMFYISRHFESNQPILGQIKATAPYIIFLLIYTLGFTFVSFIVNLAALGFKKLRLFKE